MKKIFMLTVLSFVTVWALALPKVHVIATGCCLGEKIFEAGSVFKNDSHVSESPSRRKKPSSFSAMARY